MTTYERYCKIRDAKGYKDSQVAATTGIGKSTFSDWKNGRSNPKNDKLQKIADLFEISVDYFFTGEEKQGYYLNEETAKLAQEMFEDPDMRSLFSMKRKMTPERFQTHMEFMKTLYKQETGEEI